MFDDIVRLANKILELSFKIASSKSTVDEDQRIKIVITLLSAISDLAMGHVFVSKYGLGFH